MKILRIIVAISLLIGGCKGFKKQTTKTDESVNEEREGGFLIKTPSNDKAVDFSEISVKVIDDNKLVSFPKRMQTYGTVFAAMKNVPDDFLQEVAVVFHEMFPQSKDLNLKKQHLVLNTMLKYRSLIPVLEGRYETISEDVNKDFEKINQKYSVCDIIMYKDGTGRQTMEVVEHLLHYVTSIGLHLTAPDDWSFTNKKSTVNKVMQKAIDLGLYRIENYAEIKRESVAVYQRILVQEFAYWLISTYWNLQEPYGPIAEREWNIDNANLLKYKLPEGYNLVKNSIDDIMKSPSKNSLDAFKKYN